MLNVRLAPVLVVCAAPFWVAGCGLDGAPTDRVSTTAAALTENTPPTVDAGPDLTINWPAAAALHGVTTDDFLPDPPAAYLTTWTVSSGPGAVTFRPDFAADTTAVFSQEGTYVLRLTANDSELTAFDEVTVTVVRSPFNQPPIVEIGPDTTHTVDETGLLVAILRDDSLPNPPAALTVLWTLVSGPGNATIFHPTAPITEFIVDTAGYYTFNISVSDGELSTSASQVHLFHRAAVFDAGPDQTIVLPESVQLNGSVTDDGFPQPPTIFPVWLVSEGPGTVTFANDLALVTTASFSAPGRYVLLLGGHDGSIISAYDEVVVTVLPEDCDRHHHGQGGGHDPDHNNGQGHDCR